MEAALPRCISCALHANACAKSTVVFFVGDQLPGWYPACLRRYQEPDYIFDALRRRFPQCRDGIIVYPATLAMDCFSVYSQFLVGHSPHGDPSLRGYIAALEHSKAWRCLHGLLAEEGLPLVADPTIDAATEPLGADDDGGLHLVGFSRGGLVLNQLLAELSCPLLQRSANVASCSPSGASDQMDSLFYLQWGLRCLRSVHYVDSGASSPGAYIDHPTLLRQLGLNLSACRREGFRVSVNATWRQCEDPQRPELRQEMTLMCNLMRSLCGLAVEQQYFDRSHLPLPGTAELLTASGGWTKDGEEEGARDGSFGPGDLHALHVGLLAHMQCMEVFSV